MDTTIKKSFQYGQHQVTLETGHIARQATGSVVIRMDDTVLLATVVANKETDENRDFLPLTVEYREKTYAAGKIPGGYFKREGKPTERETLISRLIDRPIRPLFPKYFNNEVQVVITVLSVDPNAPTDVAAILATSAALALSGVPFNGPVGCARVGFFDGQYMLNPPHAELSQSRLDLVVAGTSSAVLMVESEADELTEAQMLGAVLFGHEQMQVAINAINELAESGGKARWDWQPPTRDNELAQQVAQLVQSQVKSAYGIKDKLSRQEQIAGVLNQVTEQLCVTNEQGEETVSESDVQRLFHELEGQVVRSNILAGEPRIDGRDTVTVRPLTMELNLLPRAHGSALFTRGETQALVVTTLGTEKDAQMIDDLTGDRCENFMLHYNFPPFSVGEVGFLGGPKRREIGHGKLAKRALEAVIPSIDQFPYVIRVVSEITESNGSSSMATVCGTSLALMDAGIPVKRPVAGIAMGLIKEQDRFAVLTDILGDEDHLGDMDFKVAGTEQGVTALQMDIKIEGITRQIMEAALNQAKDARMHILEQMKLVISQPRETVSKHAPRIFSIEIDPEKIGDVIGKGGSTIRDITESTNTTIDISDKGVVKIAAMTEEDANAAKKRIEDVVADVEIGKIYEGTVVKITDFGAFVSILAGKQGLVHISQIVEERVNNVSDHLTEGQQIRVKVIDIDRQGRIRMSVKEVDKQL